MGTAVYATCECGLETEITIGAGFSDFPHVCLFPALCRQCERVIEANLAREPVRCPECGTTQVTPYTDPALAKGDGHSTVAAWGDVELSDGHYHCPACKQMTLHFAPTGLCWD